MAASPSVGATERCSATATRCSWTPTGSERAGHLIPEKVILGEGVRAQVWGGPDVVVEMQPDPETQMPLFTPRRVADTGRGDVAAVVCRIRPNVDLVGMVETHHGGPGMGRRTTCAARSAPWSAVGSNSRTGRSSAQRDQQRR